MTPIESSSIQQQNWLSAAIDAAHEGGRVLQHWRGRFSVREKSRANLVTEADEASQAAIVQSLKSRFPEHGFLGEENLNDRSADTECFWIIDPLDGTTNYVHGFPY
jgi:myo-inositol-1(or 4)-monophosphatase